MVPGEEVSACVEVIYTGEVTDVSPIVLYAALEPGANALADSLEVTVERGAGGHFGDCGDFEADARVIDHLPLRELATTHGDFDSGVPTLTPVQTRTSVSYLFTVTLNPATPDSLQGGVAGATFTWEVRAA